MLNLLKADFYKLKKSKAFWILNAVALAMCIIAVIASKISFDSFIGNSELPDKAQAQLSAMAHQASGVWALTTQLPMIPLLVGIFVAIFLTSEFTHGTMKNILSKGAVRIKVYASKFIVCGFVSIVMLIVSWVALAVLGSIVWGFDPQGIASVSKLVVYLLLMSLLTVSYTAVFTFIAMSIRSNGGTVAVNVVISVMMSVLIGWINLIIGYNVDLTKYWLDGPINTLANANSSAILLSYDSEFIVRAVIVAIAWGVAAIAGGMVLFQKRDVK